MGEAVIICIPQNEKTPEARLGPGQGDKEPYDIQY